MPVAANPFKVCCHIGCYTRISPCRETVQHRQHAVLHVRGPGGGHLHHPPQELDRGQRGRGGGGRIHLLHRVLSRQQRHQERCPQMRLLTCTQLLHMTQL